MDRLRKDSGFDFPLFLTAVTLWVIGIALVYSATHLQETGPLVHVTRNQIVWVTMGIIVMLLVLSLPNRFYYSTSYIIYGLSCLLLVAAVFAGVVSKGAGRWIAIGGIKIQPSEFAKIGLLLALAHYLSNRSISLFRLSSLVVPCLLIIVPFALVIKQPDLGTAMVFCAMSVPLFYWAGMTLLEVFFLASPGLSLALSAVPLILSFSSHTVAGFTSAIPWGVFFILLIVVLYLSRPPLHIWVGVIVLNIFTATITNVVWNTFLKDYQKDRILTLIDPMSDPSGSGYQVIQSKVAIGSGHILGKGYLQGTQTRLSYLPEQHTDFIFSVLGEQFGLLGCAVVIALFLFLIVRGYLSTQVVKSRFGNLLVVGSATILAFHIFVNVAMTLGMMPVTGIPLPFLSYGGSFTITIAVLVGLILSARTGRQDY